MSEISRGLRAILAESQAHGFFGPGPLDDHIEHALGFADAIGSAPESLVDLGTGGGVPGLVLAEHWPTSRVLLVEGMQRRARHLEHAIERLALSGRVVVRSERAEELGRDPTLRESFAVATARSFAVPAVTAEIAVGLLAIGGRLIVSEPPAPEPGRWPDAKLDALGFAPAQAVSARDVHYVRIFKAAAAPLDAPRSTGRPAKRPRW